MEKFLKRLVVPLMIGMILIGMPTKKAHAQPGVYVSFQEFYDYLSPYGQWINTPDYGYVWSPYEDRGTFRPYYTNGYWAMTEFGNTWVSDYPWGWACFHYGRWIYDSYYGWLWIPGSEWAPAWVAWRGGGDYYGWAPLSPGITIGVSFGNYYCPDDWWVFLPARYIYEPRHYHYWDHDRNRDYIRNTTFIRNSYDGRHGRYLTGPRESEIRSITHRPVVTYRLDQRNAPGGTRVSSRTIQMYRPPVIAHEGKDGHRPAPPKVIQAPRRIGQPAPVQPNREAPFKAEQSMRNNQPQRVERPQAPQRTYQPPQRTERPQAPQRSYQPPQRSERPQAPQRMERPQAPQRVEHNQAPQRNEEHGFRR